MPNRVETTKVGKKGVFTIPANSRRRYGFGDGTLIIAEEREDGLLLRPAVATPVEIYSRERIAEFLLNNVVDANDYEDAMQEVRDLGLDPATIPHVKPIE
jgi:bifunctional DNA-binding transcriptional regulator/antitoxin component of YhaV-PrlF toxin-antitoxin module